MKIVQINAYYKDGSTGKICASISNLLTSHNVENYVFYTQGKHISDKAINYNFSKLYTLIQSAKSRILGNNGFNSIILTYKLILYLNKINPDIVHLHNLHAQNVNLTILFKFLKKSNINTLITFHDCWLLTGYCMHFDMIGCNKWKTGCKHCQEHKKYSFLFNKSFNNWNKKRNLISDLKPYITTPSNWMKNIVQNSLIDYSDIKVIYNGINLNVFKPTHFSLSTFTIRKKYTVLGVAERWNEKKGLDVFEKLSRILSDEYQIILVGVDKNIQKNLSSNILSINRTQNQLELAQLYSCADVFVNATREEVLGLVNLESLACGTPVVTFKTGGSPECIDEKTGIIVEKNDIFALKEAIEYICQNHPFLKKDCLHRASMFDEKNLYKQYYDLYLEIMDKQSRSDRK